jgi:chemotaxis protein MotA
MKFLVGIVFVLACVLGGFVLHHGKLAALFVPTEYLIIGGCLFGGMIIKNPVSVLMRCMGEIMALIKGTAIRKKHYLELLQMLYELLQLARKDGVLALESHATDPKSSPIFSKYPSFLRNHEAVHFTTDSLKLFVSGVINGLDDLMERDLETLHQEELEPAEALGVAADSLPAIGIVAAVLGIILTMSAIDEGAAAVGRKVAGALVGTFLGVFVAYGFVGPMAGAVRNNAEARSRYLQCIRHVIASGVTGMNPALAAEMGRRSIYAADRPSFEELEGTLRGRGAA